MLAELELGGGVWRLKDITPASSACPQEENGGGSSSAEYVILASCMHAGARILRLRGNGRGEGAEGQQQQEQEQEEWEWEFEVLAKFEEHESMNYGSDVQPLPSRLLHQRGREGEDGQQWQQRTVVSTSFYDRLLAVWRW